MRIALIQQHASEDIEANIQRGLDNLDNEAAKVEEAVSYTHLRAHET